MILSRRSFLGGALAAPVIVKAASLMPVRPLIMPSGLVGVARVIEDGEPVGYMYSDYHRVRALLEPGLREIFYEYPLVPADWRKVFA